MVDFLLNPKLVEMLNSLKIFFERKGFHIVKTEQAKKGNDQFLFITISLKLPKIGG